MSKGHVLSKLGRCIINTGLESQNRELHTTLHSAATRAAVVQARLDKNRNLLPPLRYEIVTPDKFEQATELLYATYHPFEPLTKHLGLSAGNTPIPDLDKLVESTIKENLSLFARDLEGNLMGVCINGVSRRDDWTHTIQEATSGFQDPRVRILAAIRQEVHNKGAKIFDEVGTDVMFGIKMVGIHPSLRGKGMSTDIIRRSILLAGCLGFEGLKAEATASYAAQAFYTIGFSPVVEISYKDFEYEGEKVFEGIEDEQGLILFQKKFFQSCLKHIV
jgi:hypothetical protein